MTEHLSVIAIWTGAIVGLLKVIDWLLLEFQKAWISGKLEDLWLWLSEQKSGDFTSLVRSRRTQIGFSIVTHITIIVISIAFLFSVHSGIDTGAWLEIGHPRIYSYQAWVDVVALIISGVLVSIKFHPMVTHWITSKEKLGSYYLRSFLGYIGGFFVMGILVAIQWPIFSIIMEAPTDQGNEVVIKFIEDAFGGQIGVTLLHGVTALISAPVLAEVLMLQFILFLSVYWLLLVYAMIVIFRILQFILLRVVENKNGPVLALSGFLIGLGAIAKAVIA